ncbi:hypothetical protein DERF_003708 [Dermatophagoides farinae]|uniref:Uncharacterized protein n=1 Tax=Dermatophagoides farinae TaxID=6954 RepID=A0A922IHB1_DERFA|nr:hypothetical protein DERF_003708 [Dermatophagoides farinae]
MKGWNGVFKVIEKKMAARGQNDYLSSMIFNFISFVIGGNFCQLIFMIQIDDKTYFLFYGQQLY